MAGQYIVIMERRNICQAGGKQAMLGHPCNNQLGPVVPALERMGSKAILGYIKIPGKHGLQCDPISEGGEGCCSCTEK